ncbi:MAG: tRNA uridine-5-carboxymethylaminomethyl(34) synthesis GTPase MnmE [Candidatus Tectomicrobia bacterium]|nr:tRNA uridine-5-carboxymethylaminomethyl(34) synthesis GTPase MnmE [Candidatus Tectomicrobia bacterium]
MEAARTDTIAAIATPLGVGGIAVVRCSGPQALDVAQRVFVRHNGLPVTHLQSHHAYHGFVVDGQGERIDEALLCVMRRPRSYTREDVAEISCHGGVLITQRVLDAVLEHGVRVAEPGEFTRRAFLNGRLDLTQAEAVIDLINARSQASHRAAVNQLDGALSRRLRELREELIQVSVYLEAGIDFPEEDLQLVSEAELDKRLAGVAAQLEALAASFARGRLLRDGMAVAVVGRPNVGKSSLLNAMLGRDRAIVSPQPGTTRDTIEEELTVGGVLVRLTDTAGLHGAADVIEQEGMRRARSAVERAELLIVVLDGSVALTAEDRMVLAETADAPRLVVRNKCDLPPSWSAADLPCRGQILDVSALRELGLSDLQDAVVRHALGDDPLSQDEVLLTRARHHQSIKGALHNVRTAQRALQDGIPLECVALDTGEALQNLVDVLGESIAGEVLDRIFHQFCVGK